MPELAAPATPSPFGILWRGHVFLFDKKREPATFGDAADVRLVLIVLGGTMHAFGNSYAVGVFGRVR